MPKRLQLVAERDELHVMNISCRNGTASVEMTARGFDALRNAILDWCRGGEDFGVSARNAVLKNREFGSLDLSSGELWFWGPGYAGP